MALSYREGCTKGAAKNNTWNDDEIPLGPGRFRRKNLLFPGPRDFFVFLCYIWGSTIHCLGIKARKLKIRAISQKANVT